MCSHLKLLGEPTEQRREKKLKNLPKNRLVFVPENPARFQAGFGSPF